MSKSLIELIAEEKAAKAVSLVEKTLAKKVRQAISEQKATVARDCYGTLAECFGADETPEFLAHDDNAYLVFFQNALKKFGVTGPQDFTDENTKKQFFDYVDANWKAQDAVQNNNPQNQNMQPMQQGAGGGSMENGTQTRLPNPAAQPAPPNMAANGAVPQQTLPQGGSNDPSLATMAPNGPSIDKTAPLGADGDDSDLDADQDQQNAMNNGQDAGIDDESDEFDQDPDLEIGGEENSAGNDFSDEDDDPYGSEDDDEDESQAPQFDQQNSGDDDDGDLDDDFDDEDAYSVDHNDFLPAEDEDDSDEDEDDDSDQDSDDDDSDYDSDDSDDSDEDEDDDDSDSDDDDSDDEDYSDEDDDEDDDDSDDDSDDDDSDEDDDDEDPDLDISDDDVTPKKNKFPMTEDFGFGDDNLEDALYIAEKFELFSKAKEALKSRKLSPEEHKAKMDQINGGMKKVSFVQKALDHIKGLRNQMSKALRKQRSAIKSDHSKSGDEKRAALKKLAQLAQNNRKHFKTQAKEIKAMHTGQKSGSDKPAEQAHKEPQQKRPQQDKPQQKAQQPQRPPMVQPNFKRGK
jgi:hypothetical protein